jgi:hypothetical protein
MGHTVDFDHALGSHDPGLLSLHARRLSRLEEPSHEIDIFPM